MTSGRGGVRERGQQPIFPIGPRRSRRLREPFGRRLLHRLSSNGTLALVAGVVLGAVGGDLAQEWLHPAPPGSVAASTETPSASVVMMALPAEAEPEPEPQVAPSPPEPDEQLVAAETPEPMPEPISDPITAEVEAAPEPIVAAATPSTTGPDRDDIDALIASIAPEESTAPAAGADASLPAMEAPEIPLPTPVEVEPPAGTPAWLAYAVPVTEPVAGRAMIAIIIDDVGLNRPNAARSIRLPGPVTLSFLTYADELPKQADAARRNGHELMLHVPMEPLDARQDAGPDMLGVDMPPDEIRRRLVAGLDRLQGYVGINNHMGSRFTRSPDGMAVVMQELRRRGLLFLDSVTINDSVGDRMATLYGIPHANRDVFLDNDMDASAVDQMLRALERVARERGYAIGIGHPHPATLAALERWLPTLRARGFELVPVSTIVRRVTPPTG